MKLVLHANCVAKRVPITPEDEIEVADNGSTAVRYAFGTDGAPHRTWVNVGVAVPESPDEEPPSPGPWFAMARSTGDGYEIPLRKWD